MNALATIARKFNPTSTSLTLPDDLSEKEWRSLGEGIAHVEGGVQWWIGDWWNFGEAKYGEKKGIVESDDWNGPAYQSCRHAAVVCSAFELCRRRHNLSFSHHYEVAFLPPAQADALLDEAERGKLVGDKRVPLSVRELRAAVGRLKQVTKQAILPDGKFGTIVIDPPWPMEKIEREVRPNQKGFDYDTMDGDELIRFGETVNKCAADDCHLFMWTTQKFLPLALSLLEPWGFRYVLTMVWHKPGGFQPIGLPQYNCEFALYARKGSPEFVDTKNFFCCFEAPRREHSRKPDEFYDTIRRVTADGRIEIFSRELREGFAQFGDEVGKFVEAA